MLDSAIKVQSFITLNLGTWLNQSF